MFVVCADILPSKDNSEKGKENDAEELDLFILAERKKYVEVIRLSILCQDFVSVYYIYIYIYITLYIYICIYNVIYICNIHIIFICCASI